LWSSGPLLDKPRADMCWPSSVELLETKYVTAFFQEIVDGRFLEA